LAHGATLLLAKAKIVTDDFTIRGASQLFDVGSASATKKTTNFDRHWRNARTLSSHNPTSFKARSVGQPEINGTPLPAKASSSAERHRWRRKKQMARSDIHLVRENNEFEQQFRLTMRRLAGGVSVITAGRGDDIAGMTVTSLTSLSVDPPRLLISINRQASSVALIERHRVFGVNILGSDQVQLAKQFSNGTLKGRQRFDGIDWHHGSSGVPILAMSLATIECRVEEIIERHSHGIIIGSPLDFELSSRLSSLVYWNGGYVEIDGDNDLDLLADVSIPLAHVR
jgi:flavin reductase (DIM6/NTAB) family NADH-FMN oxidoreductase RutF